VDDNRVSIRVTDLRRVYPAKRKQLEVVANDGLTFEVRRGEVFGLLGPNGAGKTTLILQLLGLARPTSGHIWLEGIDVVREPKKVKPLTSYLPQSALPMRFVAVENALRYTGRLRGQTAEAARNQTEELICELDLTAIRKRNVQGLSGGMLRLTHFAMALMGNPQVVVLDEPTNELDPSRRKLVWNMIAQRNRQLGMTCVLVTHNVLEAEKVVQRVAVMRAGRMIALGTPGELKARFGYAIRLDLHLQEGLLLSAQDCSLLQEFGRLEHLDAGRYRCYLSPLQVARVADLVATRIGFEKLEDFRLSPPSLEDIYLDIDSAYASAPQELVAAGPRS